MTMKRAPFVAFAFVVFGCVAHVAGSLQVDGAPFQPTFCRSGQAHGYAGIELSDAEGRRLRIAENLDGSPSVVYFAPGQPRGATLGPCGGVHAVRGVGVVNGVQNLEGSAVLSCSASSPRVEGSVRFENCH